MHSHSWTNDLSSSTGSSSTHASRARHTPSVLRGGMRALRQLRCLLHQLLRRRRDLSSAPQNSQTAVAAALNAAAKVVTLFIADLSGLFRYVADGVIYLITESFGGGVFDAWETECDRRLTAIAFLQPSSECWYALKVPTSKETGSTTVATWSLTSQTRECVGAHVGSPTTSPRNTAPDCFHPHTIIYHGRFVVRLTSFALSLAALLCSHPSFRAANAMDSAGGTSS